jgi:POT family proton-dependent oligopeptide transporter
VTWDVFCLLFSIFAICAATYVMVPLLPIYFVESLSNGGLAWSKAEAFTLYGTFLALVYITPFFGGLLGDFVLGKSISALLGYGFIINGLIFLTLFSSKEMLSFSLFSLSFGFGFVKVSLTAAFGGLPDEVRHKIYEYYYLATCLGFIVGGLLSNPIFTAYTMTGVVKTVLGCTLVSMAFFFGFFRNKVFLRSLKKPSAAVPSSEPQQASVRSFFTLLALGVPFFICASQLTTGIPMYLHQCVDRNLGGWTIPTLWFGAIGSLIMTILSPWLRKRWSSSSSQMVEGLKISVGFAIISLSLALIATLASLGASFIPPVSAIIVLLGANVMSCIADFHVRPTLFASATILVPYRYHTLSTGLVYCCAGLGGKLAGTLVSFVDIVGFSAVFGACSSVAILCGFIALLWWRRSPLLT